MGASLPPLLYQKFAPLQIPVPVSSNALFIKEIIFYMTLTIYS